MYQTNKETSVISGNGVSFCVIRSNNSERPFGIVSRSDLDPIDEVLAENLFFTEDEARHCCLWLSENQVEPIIMLDVLDNFYRL